MKTAPSRVASAFLRRAKFNIIAFTLTVLIAVASLQAADLWWRRDRMIEAAETRANNLAVMFSEYIRGSFASADAALRQIVIHGRRVGGASQPDDVWDPILSSARAALPEVGSLSVTDAQGTIAHSSLHALIGEPRQDNYVFKQLAAAKGDELVIDRPYLSQRTPPQYIIPLGRRMTNDADRFDGAVVATLIPEKYQEFFRSVNVGSEGTVWVLHPDGVVLFREPSRANPINETAVGNPLYELARRNGNGVTYGPAEPGGPLAINAYRTLTDPPLIVAVSLSEASVLGDWHRQRRVSAAALGALTLTVAALVALFFRVVDARERAERELSDVQRQESDRLRDANEQLESALEREQRARQETEAASYMKDEFLMTVSHELRTPLTAIYGWARVLGTKEMSREQQSRAVAAIERNAKAQTTLIDDLLDVSRAISGKLRLDARQVNIGDVLRGAIETLGPALAAKQIVFESQLDADAGVVIADPDRLQQIVWNLLSNAIKFTPEGGSVKLHLRRSDSQVEIVVTDSGSGISPDFLPYVFERFRQGDAGSRRRYGGLGLGLAIVRHLVELHGGTVMAESAGENLGATFRVTLPVRPARADAGAAHAPLHGARPRTGARLDGARILIVDDEADARELFASILEGSGASVITASSAEEAMDALRATRIDVLVSDIEMPGEDGYSLLQRANAERNSNPLVAIAVTAYARTADRRRALEAGFKSHLAKPVEPAELVAAIAALVSNASI
jgi:signal transduction histidine kinase/ActR/RegA family two-component response regulator